LSARVKNLADLKPIIVSNRLPVKFERVDDGWNVFPGTGGLVTALAPVLENNDGIWIGWPGAPVTEELKLTLKSDALKIGYHLEMVDLTDEEITGFYRGFSNSAIWPLFHDLIDHCNFDIGQWEIYQRANYKFARTIVDHAEDNSFIWVHDYHLMLVGDFLHEMGFGNRSAYFQHIPFPPQDIFLKLPWRHELLEAILSYRLIGFQTERDRSNFIRCVRYILPEARVASDRKIHVIQYDGRTSRVGAHPISIDFNYFNGFAKSKEGSDAAWFFHEDFKDQKIIIGIDRLDYTKGIPHRLLALENCLERYPELKGKITLVQVVVPSRTEVAEYQSMKSEIDEMVGRINGRFTSGSWIPVHYIFGTLSKAELIGYYKASEIALITPLKDGMNLVSKEYCASHDDEQGVLVLSEFAGAASRLACGAILVNPYNVIEVADAIFRAFYMDSGEQRSRMRKLRSEVRRNNIFKWVEQFTASYYSGSDSEKMKPPPSLSVIPD